jgi:hypothetical protein
MPSRPPLIDKEPGWWPWCTILYLLGLAVVAYVVTASAHCASDWTFSKVALAGTILAPVSDGVLISRRRHDTQLALGVAEVSLVVGLFWLMLVILIRCGSAGAFD